VISVDFCLFFFVIFLVSHRISDGIGVVAFHQIPAINQSMKSMKLTIEMIKIEFT